MSILKRPRRYYLRKAQELVARGGDDEAVGLAYFAKQAAQSGAPLPLAFPFRQRLAAAHYTTVEDLDGADEPELMKFVQLSGKQARQVLTALTALTDV